MTAGRSRRQCAAAAGSPKRPSRPAASTEGRRIRDDARDGVYVMAFSLFASTSVALTVVLLTKLAG